MAMGLAVSAGYVLGRTKKAKLAFGLTTLVLGRKLAPDGASVASFIGSRLGDSPQLKEIREQLRTDLRGVGSAAASALVDRRLEAVADRLHDRTLDVQDRLAGLTGRDDKDHADDETDEDRVTDEDRAGDHSDEADEADKSEEADQADKDGAGGRPARKRPARKQTAARTAGRRTATSAAKSEAKSAGGTKRKSADTDSGSDERPARRTAAKRSAGRGRGGDGDA
ncbi:MULTISPECIES: DNA primase [unclassified Streptomyces]|uniref:DNA primase n=1 Tax=unclassified Streptomyces TaxID=2593676 RepID=UPI002E34AC7C|nr:MULTISPECIES: DNA primase [unclassified Streptomyces]WUC68113.1 DNA primase [Streptomyces sp. NBC_00539]